MKVNNLEINLVCKDAKQAANFYVELFGFDLISLSKEQNELSEVRLVKNDIAFQILNENKDFSLIAPGPDTIASMWLNLIVSDIEALVAKAKELGSEIISPVQDFGSFRNAVIRDSFNHVWVLNQDMEIASED